MELFYSTWASTPPPKSKSKLLSEMTVDVAIFNKKCEMQLVKHTKEHQNGLKNVNVFLSQNQRGSAKLALAQANRNEKYIQNIRNQMAVAKSMLQQAEHAINSEEMLKIQVKSNEVFNAFNKDFSSAKLNRIGKRLRESREKFKKNNNFMETMNEDLMNSIIQDDPDMGEDGDADKQLDDYIQMMELNKMEDKETDTNTSSMTAWEIAGQTLFGNKNNESKQAMEPTV